VFYVSQGYDVSGSCVVAKFGGSSLADGTRISKAAEVIAQESMKGKKIAVIVSAIGSTTDYLADITKQASNSGAISGNDIDDVLAMGERTSARIFSAALKTNGVKCCYFDPADPNWPIITDNKPTNANPILALCEKRIRKYVLPALRRQQVVVIPGFVGKNRKGSITTMGRGSSDVTALIIARALGAKQVVFVTDVDGIMTADPKLIKSAKKLDRIDVNALVDIADAGTKFIHRKALEYKDPKIDLRFVNHQSCDLNSEGTTIYGSLQSKPMVEIGYSEPTMSITIVGNALSKSPQILHEIIRQVKDSNIPILGMSIGYDSISVYLPENLAEEILEPLHSVVINNSQTLTMAVRKNIAFVKVTGATLEETPGMLRKVSQALYSQKINTFGMFTIVSGVEIFVDVNDAERALTAIRASLKVGSK
jgi:aspartate kinase